MLLKILKKTKKNLWNYINYSTNKVSFIVQILEFIFYYTHPDFRYLVTYNWHFWFFLSFQFCSNQEHMYWLSDILFPAQQRHIFSGSNHLIYIFENKYLCLFLRISVFRFSNFLLCNVRLLFQCSGPLFCELFIWFDKPLDTFNLQEIQST